MTREEYAEYLKSNWWAIRRWVALEKADYRCQGEGCDYRGTRSDYSNVSTGLHVHHLRYDNLGHEPDEDLCVLCPRCHGAAHGVPQSVGGFETLAPWIRGWLELAVERQFADELAEQAERQYQDEVEAVAEEIDF